MVEGKTRRLVRLPQSHVILMPRQWRFHIVLWLFAFSVTGIYDQDGRVYRTWGSFGRSTKGGAERIRRKNLRRAA